MKLKPIQFSTELGKPIKDILNIIVIGDGIVVITKYGKVFTNARYFLE